MQDWAKIPDRLEKFLKGEDNKLAEFTARAIVEQMTGKTAGHFRKARQVARAQVAEKFDLTNNFTQQSYYRQQAEAFTRGSGIAKHAMGIHS